MSTTIRRSSRRAASKSSISAIVDDSLINNQQENISTTLLKDDCRFTNSDSVRGQDDIANASNLNNKDSSHGRGLRRQTSSSSPKLSDGVNAPSTVGNSNDPSTTSTSLKREGTVSPDSSNTNSMTEKDDDHECNDHKSKKSRKTVTFDGSTEMNVAAANSESDTSKRSRTAAQLAREQRSRRRQAAQGTDGSDHSVAVAPSRKPDSRINHKKKVSGSTSNNSSESDTDVVRVPMLTGTLILYRGARPRAVFIRRV